ARSFAVGTPWTRCPSRSAAWERASCPAGWRARSTRPAPLEVISRRRRSTAAGRELPCCRCPSAPRALRLGFFPSWCLVRNRRFSGGLGRDILVGPPASAALVVFVVLLGLLGERLLEGARGLHDFFDRLLAQTRDFRELLRGLVQQVSQSADSGFDQPLRRFLADARDLRHGGLAAARRLKHSGERLGDLALDLRLALDLDLHPDQC